MSHEDVSQKQEKTVNPDQMQPRPLSKPQRRTERSLKRVLSWLLPLLGCLLLLGGGLAWYTIVHQTPPASHRTRRSTATVVHNCGTNLPIDWIKQQLPPYLHLTVAQVTAEVQGGKNIQVIAAKQGISASLLYADETHIIKLANNNWLQQGCITQEQYSGNVQHFLSETKSAVNADFTGYYKS